MGIFRNFFFGITSLTTALAPFSAVAVFHEGAAPGRSELAPGRQYSQVSPVPSPSGSLVPRGLLRQAKHAERLVRVLGLVNGMTNKLSNLAQRLSQHLENVERRLAALQAAGHDITVDIELEAARTLVTKTTEDIAALVDTLGQLADNERPRVILGTLRTGLTTIRADLRNVRNAFQLVRVAVRKDLAAEPSPSPSTSPVPTSVVSPLASPTASPAVPTPSPTL